MSRNKEDILDPAELPGRLRRMAVGGVIGILLLLVSNGLLTVVQINHTSDVVGTSNQLLGRGDCRSAVTADLWTDLATLLKHASADQKAAISDDAENLKEAADNYYHCSNLGSAPTTTKGS